MVRASLNPIHSMRNLPLFYILLKKPQCGPNSILPPTYQNIRNPFSLRFLILVSVEIAIDPYTEHYYKSFHSHIWFYLVGFRICYYG